MKQGRNLNDVIIELDEQSKAKKDFVSPSKSLTICEDGSTLNMGEQEFQMTPLFHNQLGTALSIPAKYYDKMRNEAPDLLAENVNRWLKESDKNYMIRTISENARAFLSERYRRIDNLDIASIVLPLFAGKEGVEVMSCEVTEARLYLKIVNHRLEKMCVGDQVQAGVVVSNSEVGLGAVSVKPLIYTLACTNGMIVDTFGERKTHIGRAAKGMDDFQMLSDETKEAEDRAFSLKLRDVTLAAIEEARFDRIIKVLEDSHDAKITGDVQKVVELSSKQYDLTATESSDVLRHLINGGDLSLYGLSNAVTRASQDVESYDRATTLENIGWKMTTMGKHQWDSLNER